MSHHGGGGGSDIDVGDCKSSVSLVLEFQSQFDLLQKYRTDILFCRCFGIGTIQAHVSILQSKAKTPYGGSEWAYLADLLFQVFYPPHGTFQAVVYSPQAASDSSFSPLLSKY